MVVCDRDVMESHVFSPKYDTDPRCAWPDCDAREEAHELTWAPTYVPYEAVTWWTPSRLVTLPPGATRKAPACR